MKDAISQVYEGKECLIIIGLTGRTGAGCSTVAKILEKKHFQDWICAMPNIMILKTAKSEKNASSMNI